MDDSKDELDMVPDSSNDISKKMATIQRLKIFITTVPIN